MPLFKSRPQADSLEGILLSISLGRCDDSTIKSLQRQVDEMDGDDVKSLADILMTNLVKFPDDVAVLIGSVEALEALPYLPKAKNEFIITLLLSLLKAPVNRKDALERKTLKREIVRFLLFFVSEDDSYAKLMMPELILALDETNGSASSGVYHVLHRIAVEKPEYFERYSAALIKQLGSINKSTRAESAKLIGIIAKTHPEYVSSAMPFLQSLASFYPDAHVKRNANEAYRIIQNSVKHEPAAPAAHRTTSEGKGLADIMKLNSGTPNGNVQAAQFTDDELKDIIELTRKEFKSDAEAILNSLGVGHLTVKSKENKARQKLTQQKPASEETAQTSPVKVQKLTQQKPVSEETAQTSPVKVQKLTQQKPVSEETAPINIVKVKKAIYREKSLKEEKTEADNISTLQEDIDNILKRGPKETATQKPSSSKDPVLKCPKCGGRSWANGKLCDKCAGEEFDRKAARGHYDMGR